MTKKPTRQLRLSSLLKRAHLYTTLIAVCLAGLSLTTASLFAMRGLAEHNLQLVARSLSYTVEAAVVFSDAEAANQSLQLIATHEALGSARITDRHGRLLAEWNSPDQAERATWQHAIGRITQPPPVHMPILHDQTQVGELTLSSNNKVVNQFLLKGLLLLSLSLGLAVAGSLYLTHRIAHRISRSLNNLIQVTHRVRTERDFKARVPRAKIAEFNELGQDFNTLLAELHDWNLLHEQEKHELNHQASHDRLTGLANRALFDAELTRARLTALSNNSRFAVLYIDADHFKTINDQHGHAAGDHVLQELANRLRNQVRQGDTVARLGGDEFAVLLPPPKNINDISRVADGITHSMQQPIRLKNGQEIILGLSIGVAFFPDDAMDTESLLQVADHAMYSTKHAGRGHWQYAQSITSYTSGEPSHDNPDRIT